MVSRRWPFESLITAVLLEQQKRIEQLVPVLREFESRRADGPPECVLDVHMLRVYDGSMKGGVATVRKRINITLPEETLGFIDRVTARGDRSRFIEEAVHHYIQETGRTNLRKRLKEGASRRADAIYSW